MCLEIAAKGRMPGPVFAVLGVLERGGVAAWRRASGGNVAIIICTWAPILVRALISSCCTYQYDVMYISLGWGLRRGLGSQK